ncbi:MAG: tRNA (guanine37-N1)-methyltransferase [Planctomycetaceae bacterium]|jgi:tRNA (guanine37-N1)-methyltransferase
MKISVVTLFPEMFTAVSKSGITGRAIENGLVSLDFANPRDFTQDKHRTVDDKPYGGGPGMLMKVAPLKSAIESAKAAAGPDCEVIYLSPQGQPVTQQIMQDLSERSGLVLVAGRYEGIDERLIEREIDVEYSIGDYVLSGGELPAMVLIDGITRLQPGAVGDDQSVQEDSFSAGLLDHPHYTRPEAVEGLEVPAVLLGGNHAEIKRWRQKQALGRTKLRRPDLIERRNLSADEKVLLAEFEAEQAQKIKTED